MDILERPKLCGVEKDIKTHYRNDFLSIIIQDCVLVTYAEEITAQFIKHTPETTKPKNHKPASILFTCSKISTNLRVFLLCCLFLISVVTKILNNANANNWRDILLLKRSFTGTQS